MTDPTPSEEQIASLRSHVSADARSRAFVDLSKALIAQGKHNEAAEVAQRGLLAHPDAVEGRVALAMAEAEQGHFREALDQIKRALLIDQDNAEALALMGRILLERGLAQRAAQFLSHAVKLEPDNPSYRTLLVQARHATSESGGDSARGAPLSSSGSGTSSRRHSSIPIPKNERRSSEVRSRNGGRPRVFGPESVLNDDNPWEEADAESHTVFAADAEAPKAPSVSKSGKKAKPQKGIDARLAALPTGKEDAEEEPTRINDSSIKVGASIHTEEEEPTKFAASVPQRRGKLGGSAAELSQMLRADPEPLSGRAPSRPPPVPEPDPPAMVLESSQPAQPIKPKEVVVASSSRAKEVSPKSAQAPEPKPKPKPKEVELKPDDKPASRVARGIGPVATRMVDDALFAILGRKRSAVEQMPAAASAPASPMGAPRKPRVVRTAAELGHWARVAAGIVLCGGAFGIGYTAAVAPGAAAPEIVSEELKGVATELEKGGLAALLSAEERVNELRRSNPDLEPLLEGVVAEIFARRHIRFGRSPEARKLALSALEGSEELTVERAMAEVLLSTSTKSLKELDQRLELASKRYPGSPKVWVARAQIARRLRDSSLSIAHLTRARAIHPQHRQTLLETARWLVRAQALPTAIETYALLQSLYDLDVEVAIERYMLGWASGADAAHDEAVALLAGLVREENHEVAKDEVGRASFAFALARLQRGRAEDGLNALAEAEGAFRDSPSYQSVVGRVLLALGEAERAETCFLRAIELEPQNNAYWLNLGRAQYAKQTDQRLEIDVLKKRLKRLQRELSPGVLRLPYGSVRAQPTRFELVEVELKSGSFPESYLHAAMKADADRKIALQVAVRAALANRALNEGDMSKAREHLRAARKAKLKLPILGWVRGRLFFANGELSRAVREFKAASDKDPSAHVMVQLDLARALAASGDVAGSASTYETFFKKGGVSPDAWLEYAQLKVSVGNIKSALKALKSLETIEPQSASAVVLRAEIYLEQERFKRAQELLVRAMELNPSLTELKPPRGLRQLSPALIMQMGRLVYKDNRKKGLSLLRVAAARPDAQASTHFFLGKALVSSRKTRRSGRRELKRYLELDPRGRHVREAVRLRKRR